MTRRVEQFRVAAQFILNIKQEANIQRRIVLVDARGVQFQLVAQLLDNVVPDFRLSSKRTGQSFWRRRTTSAMWSR